MRMGRLLDTLIFSAKTETSLATWVLWLMDTGKLLRGRPAFLGDFVPGSITFHYPLFLFPCRGLFADPFALSDRGMLNARLG